MIAANTLRSPPSIVTNCKIQKKEKQSMFLSEYVVVDTKGGFVDPLGFMRPAGAFQAGLFKQFTVLS
ncbi:MAG: hypothetical protein RSC66_01275, partial [Comamonas sp.]